MVKPVCYFCNGAGVGLSPSGLSSRKCRPCAGSGRIDPVLGRPFEPLEDQINREWYEFQCAIGRLTNDEGTDL